MNSVGVFCHDAGGSEIISHWANSVKNFYKLEFYLKGPAVSVFSRNLTFNLKNKSEKKIEDFIESNEIILCGTSWQSNLEKVAMRKAKHLGKKTIVVLDHWVNYEERFILEKGALFVPNEVWVCDDYAEKMAKKIFDQDIVKQKSNFYTDFIKKKIDDNFIQNKRNVDNKILYVCEPVKVHAELKTGDKNFHGYTEESALKFFLDNLKIFQDIGEVILRPHPSEAQNKYNWALDYYKGRISIGGKKTLLEEIMSVNMVVGCESMAMVIAIVANKKVISSIPPDGRTCRLPHSEIIHLRDLV